MTYEQYQISLIENEDYLDVDPHFVEALYEAGEISKEYALEILENISLDHNMNELINMLENAGVPVDDAMDDIFGIISEALEYSEANSGVLYENEIMGEVDAFIEEATYELFGDSYLTEGVFKKIKDTFTNVKNANKNASELHKTKREQKRDKLRSERGFSKLGSKIDDSLRNASRSYRRTRNKITRKYNDTKNSIKNSKIGQKVGSGYNSAKDHISRNKGKYKAGAALAAAGGAAGLAATHADEIKDVANEIADKITG